MFACLVQHPASLVAALAGLALLEGCESVVHAVVVQQQCMCVYVMSMRVSVCVYASVCVLVETAVCLSCTKKGITDCLAVTTGFSSNTQSLMQNIQTARQVMQQYYHFGTHSHACMHATAATDFHISSY